MSKKMSKRDWVAAVAALCFGLLWVTTVGIFSESGPKLSIEKDCSGAVHLTGYFWTLYYEDTCDGGKVKFYKTFLLREVFEDGVWKKKIFSKNGYHYLGYWYLVGETWGLDFFSHPWVELNYVGCGPSIRGYIGTGGFSSCPHWMTMFVVKGSKL